MSIIRRAMKKDVDIVGVDIIVVDIFLVVLIVVADHIVFSCGL